MHPQLKCHTTMTMTRSALRIHFINLFLSYERQRQIGKRSTKTKAKCECVCVCVSVQTKRQQREREREVNRKLHWNYSNNYFQIELHPITNKMKCRWRKDSDTLIRRNGVVAEGGTGGTAGRDVQEGQLWQGGRVSECVWVSSVSPASSSSLWHGRKGNARQKRKKPIRVVACAACGCHWGRGRRQCGGRG